MSDNSTPIAQESTRIHYIAGLDGLRAIAVAAVFLYHIEPNILPGGFLGVQVFFVISGYLIAGLLLKEWRATGNINLAQFWLRRARRLLPALVVLVAGTMLFVRLALPDEVAGLRGDALSSLFYVANWYFVLVQKPYFQAIGRPSLFQHIWSLAVEEQFYILFPIALIFLLRRVTARSVLIVILAGAALSAIAMAVLYNPDVDPSRVYYGTDTRATGLLLGVALAMIWKPSLNRARIVDVLGFVGLAGIAIALVALGEYEPFLYYGGFSLVALFTCLVIAALTIPSSALGKLLGGRLLRWVGTRSYSIYLWHYVILMVTRPQLDVPFDGAPLLLARLALTLVAAEVSYRWVEYPIRNGALQRMWLNVRDGRRNEWAIRWVAAISILVLISIALGETVVNAQAPAPAAVAVQYNLESSTSDSPASVSPTDVPTAVPTVAAIVSTSVVAPTPQPPKPLTPPASPKPFVRSPSTLAIGDSVMLGASGELGRVLPGIEIDAAVGRQIAAGLDTLHSHLSGKTYDTVIVQLGNNGPVSARQFDELMKTLASVRRVIVVNVSVPRAWQNTNNAVMAQGIKSYPNVVLVDWNAASASHGDYFAKDGVHLRPAGAKVYVGLIAAGVNAP